VHEARSFRGRVSPTLTESRWSCAELPQAAFSKKENLTWRSFSDPRTSDGLGAISKKWNLAGTPTIYLIDHTGVIRYKWLGGAREKVIDDAVEELIRKME